MIIFGSRSSHIKSSILDYENCPNCGQQNKLLCSVYGNYAHIFWIPIFPTSKNVAVQCQNCGAQWGIYQMPPDLKNVALKFRKEQRTPPLHFIGLFLIAAFIAFIAYAVHDDKKKTASYLLDPQVGDLYRIRLNDDGYYSTMRIEFIEGDTAFFALNNYSTNKSSNISDIDKEKNYDTESLYPIAKKDLDLKSIDEFSLDKITRKKHYK